MNVLVKLAEKKSCPDSLIRVGIRQLVKQRLHDEGDLESERQEGRYRELLAELRKSRIAIDTDLANEQHYEVPAAFFRLVLGERLKYSACHWGPNIHDLDQAEVATLEQYAKRAQISDGHRILDLGCGWGSFSLWAAERFPASEILAVSNSNSQRAFIEDTAAKRGLKNLRVLTTDVNELQIEEQFDRVISIEMFEHVRNYAVLLKRISGWLKPDGKLFVHIFCHHRLMYPFDSEGADNWMGRLFFSGGLMPARDTLLHFQDDLRLDDRWDVNGSHYQRTARAWLDNLDRNHDAVRKALASGYPDGEIDRWVQRWRIFFMACEELFGYQEGRQWQVCHYLFSNRSAC